MMSTPLSEFILARATAMAEADGSPVSDLHIVGAANQIQAEIPAARNALLGGAAGSAHSAGAVDTPVADIAEMDPEPVPEAPQQQEAAPVPVADEPAAPNALPAEPVEEASGQDGSASKAASKGGAA